MYIPRKLTATFLIACLMAFIGFIVSIRPFFDYFMILSFGLAFFITYVVVSWVGNEPQTEAKSQRKVEKLLRELDDNDLDLLRTRLMRQERSDDYAYESMAELVQSGKRKNEVR